MNRMLSAVASSLALAAAVAAAVLGALGVSAADAATFIVNSFVDGVDAAPGDGCCSTVAGLCAAVCTLRAAVQETNARGGADTIVLPGGTYTLTVFGPGEDNAATGDLDIRDGLTISGGSRGTVCIAPGVCRAIFTLATVQGASGWNDRIFQIHPGVIAQFSGLKVQGGSVSGADGGGIRVESGARLTLTGVSVTGNDATSGGGISNLGTLALVSSTLSSNGAFGSGGGLFNVGTATVTGSTIGSNVALFDAGGGVENCGSLTVDSSTLAANSAGAGAGLGNGAFCPSGALGPPEAFIANTTFSGNTAGTSGGGILNENAFLDVRNVTLTNNAANPTGTGGGHGGGIANGINGINAGIVYVSDTIIAGNGDNSPTGKAPDCSGALVATAFNLIQTITGCIGDFPAQSIIGQDPQLGPLQNNGGPTATHAPLAGSPAIDAGDPDRLGLCQHTDQRGVTRPLDGNGDGIARCDIGAVEVSPVGAFALDPSDGIVPLGERLRYTLAYTVTGGRSWRELSTLDVRFKDAQGIALWLRFNEVPGAPGTFTVINPKNGDVGPAFALGSHNRLQTSAATLYLAGTAIDPNDPDTSSVILSLELGFKPRAAGRTFDVEVVATDHSGHTQGPDVAGTVQVERPRDGQAAP